MYFQPSLHECEENFNYYIYIISFNCKIKVKIRDSMGRDSFQNIMVFIIIILNEMRIIIIILNED